ncbi:unnamed protein product [Caenorhabditis angaria]|uniref:SNF7 family protein n=1 Tax=Caenorhabditis angaria TaxID=860376 RepID=A0A9P1IKK2_9PELO|nr:unnamed protein product [Caenorhabditis angaria]
MSWLWNPFGYFFGGSTQEQEPNQEEAIKSLRESEKFMKKKQEYLEKKVIEEKANAIKYGKQNNKRLAIQALNRINTFEKELNHIDKVLANIEANKYTLENASSNSQMLKGFMTANKALTSANNNMNAAQVDELMDDLSEQQGIANQIAEAISSPIGCYTDFDDEELAKQLKDLEQEKQEQVTLPDAPRVPLPFVPAKVANKELEELESWANAS